MAADNGGHLLSPCHIYRLVSWLFKTYHFNSLVTFLNKVASNIEEPWFNQFMKNEAKKGPDIIFDFGDEFGTLEKQDIGQLFVDIHASISPLDPLNKAAAAAC